MKRKVAVVALLLAAAAVWLLLSQGDGRRTRSEGDPRESKADAVTTTTAPRSSQKAPASTTKTKPRPREAEPERPRPYALAGASANPDRAALRVLVVDRHHRPLPDVSVRITLSVDGVGTSGPRGKTDAAGRAEFEDLSQDEVIAVGIQAGDFWRSSSLRVTNGRVTEIRFVVPGGVAVRGVIRHVDKGPLERVMVALRRKTEDGFRDALYAHSDREGSYAYEQVPPGTYEMKLSSSALLYHEQQQGKLEVKAPGPVVRDIVVGRLALHGVVRDAVTKEPLAGAEVQAQSPTFATTKADENGSFRLTSLPPGKYSVLVKKPGYGLQWFKEIEVSEQPRRVEFEIAPAAKVHLYLADPEGKPLVGEHWVRFDRAGGGGWSTNLIADEKGHILYTNLAPGSYKISATGPDLKGEPAAFEIRAGENDVRLKLARTKPVVRCLSGTVRDAQTRRPIEGVRLRLLTGRAVDAYTDADGKYAFENLRPQGYRILAEKDGYGDRTVAGAKVVKGKEATFDFELEPAATLHLRVTDDRGRPVEGEVYLAYARKDENIGRGFSLELDADGRATCRRLRPGSHRLSIHARDRGLRASVEKELLAGENSLALQLEKKPD